MSSMSKELELVPISESFIGEGGYRGRIVDRGELSYDEVIDEVIRQNFLRMEPHALKMLIESVFETMINGTLKDGKSRRLGDYFLLQMEVRGKFEDPGDQFDAAKHKLALALRPLKAFRRKPGNGDVRVYNRNAGPKVVVESIASVGGESLPGVVKFGKDFVVTGENLWVLDDIHLNPQDGIVVKYSTQFMTPSYISISGAGAVTVNEAGTQMTVNWKQTVGSLIRDNPERFDPVKNPPVKVEITVESRGGVDTAKRQRHRGKAYFDTWLQRHPESIVKSKRSRK